MLVRGLTQPTAWCARHTVRPKQTLFGFMNRSEEALWRYDGVTSYDNDFSGMNINTTETFQVILEAYSMQDLAHLFMHFQPRNEDRLRQVVQLKNIALLRGLPNIPELDRLLYSQVQLWSSRRFLLDACSSRGSRTRWDKVDFEFYCNGGRTNIQATPRNPGARCSLLCLKMVCRRDVIANLAEDDDEEENDEEEGDEEDDDEEENNEEVSQTHGGYNLDTTA